MTKSKKNRWVQEYESLPEWLRNFIDAFKSSCGVSYNLRPESCHGCLNPGDCEGHGWEIKFLVPSQNSRRLSDALDDVHAFCAALSVPAEHIEFKDLTFKPEPVEIAASCEDELRFDTPCRYGGHVLDHAVYCHFETWPDHPRKCRRHWKGDEYLFQDCPGFAPNPNFKPEEPTP